MEVEEVTRSEALEKELYHYRQDCESICKYETIKNEAKCIIRESPHAHKNKKDAEGKTLPNCTPQNREDVKDATNNYESNTCKQQNGEGSPSAL